MTGLSVISDASDKLSLYRMYTDDSIYQQSFSLTANDQPCDDLMALNEPYRVPREKTDIPETGTDMSSIYRRNYDIWMIDLV